MTDDDQYDTKGNRLPKSRCPACAGELFAATVLVGKESERPRPFIPTVCAFCGALLQFDESLRLIPLGASYLLLSAEVRNAINIARAFIKSRNAMKN